MKSFAVLFVCAFGMLSALPLDYQNVKGKSENTEKLNGQVEYHENGLSQGVDWSNYAPMHLMGKSFQTRQQRSTDEQQEQMNGQVEYHETAGLGQGIDWSNYAPMHLMGKSFNQKQKRDVNGQKVQMNGQVEYHDNGDNLGQGVDWSNYAPLHLMGKSFSQRQKRSANGQQGQLNGQVEYHDNGDNLGQGVDWSNYAPMHLMGKPFENNQRPVRSAVQQQVQMNGQVEYHDNGDNLGQGVDWSNYAPLHLMGKSFENKQRQARSAVGQQVQMNGQVEYHDNGDNLGQGVDWSNYAPLHLMGKSFENNQRQARNAVQQRVQMNGQVEYHDNGDNLGQGVDWSNYAPLHLMGKSFESSTRQARDSNGQINNFPFFHQQQSGQAAMPLDDSFYYPGTAARPVNLPLNWSPEMNNKIQNQGRVARDLYYRNGSLVPMIPSSGFQQFADSYPSNAMGQYPMPRNILQQQYQNYQPTPGYFMNRLPVAPIQEPVHQYQAEDWSNGAPQHKNTHNDKPIHKSKSFSNNAQNRMPASNDESMEIVHINDDFPRKGAMPTYSVVHMEAIGLKPMHMSEYADNQAKPKNNGQYKHKPQALNHYESAADVAPAQPALLPYDNQPQELNHYESAADVAPAQPALLPYDHQPQGLNHYESAADVAPAQPALLPYDNQPQGLNHYESAADVAPTQPANLPIDWSKYVPKQQLNKPIIPRQPVAKNPTNLLRGAQKMLDMNMPNDLPIKIRSQDFNQQVMPQAQGGAVESKDEILGANMERDFQQHAQFGGVQGEQKVQRNLGGSFESRDQPIWSNK